MNRGATRGSSKPTPEPERAAPIVNKGAQGAVVAKQKRSVKLASYWRHHKQSMLEAYHRLISTPLQTLMTASVVAIALALPALLLVALDNASRLGKAWQVEPQLSVFIKVSANDAGVQDLISTIKSYNEVESLVHKTKDEALEDFVNFSGFGDALKDLDTNPLPVTLVIKPKPEFMTPVYLTSLSERISASNLVDEVKVDMEWVRKLQEMMLLGKKAVLILAVLLGAGVLLAVGNTIRLAIENRKDEIVVAKLVGGTNSFVRRPFLYSGCWYGIFGGVIAYLLVTIGYLVISPSVTRLAALYSSSFDLSGLGILGGIKLITLSLLLGLLGAWLAVSRHLSHIEPS